MAGINTTGEAKTQDYNLGRGKLFFSSLDALGHPKGYRFLGNSPEFNLTLDTETLEHQSSLEGLKVTDKEVTVSQKATATISLDELNFDNFALFFAGTASQHANTSTTGIGTGTANLVVANQGEWYDVYQDAGGLPASDSSGKRMYDLGVVTIKDVTDVTTYVLDTDYKVDLKMGRIFVIVGGAMAASTSFNLTVAAKGAGDDNVDQVETLTQSSVVGALKFISENPSDGDVQTEYQFHQISLKATGDLSMIGDEFSVMQLAGAAEKNIVADPSSPTLTIRHHTNA